MTRRLNDHPWAPSRFTAQLVRRAAVGAALVAVLLAPADRLCANESAEPVGGAALQLKIDAATDKALAFLARTQAPDGSWLSRNMQCAAGSLAVMAFLAKGHQPGEPPYGPTLNKAIDYILTCQHPNGMITRGGQMYSHGISTVMLAEVLGQTAGKRQEQVRAALAKAVKLILDAQKVPKPEAFKGGWRYQPTSSDSDISVTGWQLMALRAAKNVGADVPTEAIEKGVAYVKRSACKGGGFGYQPGGPTGHARAGTGILALELCGQHHTREALDAGDWLLANPPAPFGRAEGYLYYTMYHCSQAMFQLGDRYFAAFWPTFAEGVLKRQQPDGSWPLGMAAEANAGAAYSAAMAVLSLAVPYRVLPIYQR